MMRKAGKNLGQELNSILHSVLTMNKLQYHSGLKINQEKTIIIPVGSSRKRIPNLPKTVQKLSFNSNSFHVALHLEKN